MPRTDSCDTSGSASMTATRSSGRPCASSSRTTTTNGIPGGRQSPDPAAVDGTATPWSRPVPPAARWDVELLLSVSSVIHDRPSTPRSSFWTVRGRPRRFWFGAPKGERHDQDRWRGEQRRSPACTCRCSSSPNTRCPRTFATRPSGRCTPANLRRHNGPHVLILSAGGRSAAIWNSAASGR